MKMNKKLRRILLTVCSAALLVCVTVGATVAYLTSSATVTNTFTVGKVAITLDEAQVNGDGKPVDANDIVVTDLASAKRVTKNSYNLLPGHTYTKDPTITVVANSEEAYVRAFITVNNRADLDKLFETYDLDITDIVNGIGSNWDVAKATNTVDNNDNRIYEIRYKGTVKKSSTATKLDPLFTSIVVPNKLTNDDIAAISDLKIDVVAQAIQADGFANADAAWAAVAGN